MQKIEETNVFAFMIIFLIFIYLAFESDLATLYTLMIFADFGLWLIDKNRRIVTERTTDGRLMSLIKGITAYIIFLLLSTFAMSSLQSTIPVTGVQSILHILASSTPILKGSVILTIICWGIMVAIIETRFFGRLFEYFSDWMKEKRGVDIPVDRFTTKTILLILVVAGLFSLLHITSKQALSIPMIITALFMIISLFLIVIDKDMRSAIIYHIITNLVAVLSQLKLI